MYVEPSTNIRVLKNVPLDITYNHTIFFSAVSSQTSYFNGLVKYTFDRQTYQRVQKGTIRLEKSSDNLYDCNYLMFQNSGFGNKWFYAFIKSVEYINNSVSEITFEIDVMQTWYFDYDLKQCYVEREHVTSDKKWEHLVNEPFPLGETEYSEVTEVPFGADWTMNYVVYSTYNHDGIKASASYANGGIYGCKLYLAETKEELDKLIDIFRKIADDSIVCIQGVPSFLTVYLPTATSYKLIEGGSYVTSKQETKEISHVSIGGYTPRNNKCFNFPYYGLYISNQQGLNDVLDFSNFENRESIGYTIYGDITVNNSCVLHFSNYKGTRISHDYDLQCGQSPQAQYNTTNYNYYEQQQANAKMVTLTGGTAMLFSGNVGGAIATTVGNWTQTEMLKAQQANTPPTVHALTGNSLLSVNMKAIAPIIGLRIMKPQLIKKLDDFFDLYGYQVNTLKKPNVNARNHWSYVKTSGCVVSGSVPSDDMAKICGVYDNGVTFWKKGSEVGNYSLDNRV